MRGSQPSLDCLPTSIAERKMVISTILSPTCNTYTSAELSSGLLSWLATRVMERMVEWGLGEGTALPEDGWECCMQQSCTCHMGPFPQEQLPQSPSDSWWSLTQPLVLCQVQMHTCWACTYAQGWGPPNQSFPTVTTALAMGCTNTTAFWRRHIYWPLAQRYPTTGSKGSQDPIAKFPGILWAGLLNTDTMKN